MAEGAQLKALQPYQAPRAVAGSCQAGYRPRQLEAAAFLSAARCRGCRSCPRELPGGTTRAQAGLTPLGFGDGCQRVGGDIGAHAPAAFRRHAGGDGALVALAAQGAAQWINACESARGRCRESHAVQCRAASHDQGARGYGWRMPAQPQSPMACRRPSCAIDTGVVCWPGAAVCLL